MLTKAMQKPPQGGAPKDGETTTKQWSSLLHAVGQNQDESAFARLHAHFAPLIMGFLRGQSGVTSAEAAEEITQEVMVKVWLKANTFDAGKAAASTWIFTLTRNARIDYLRKQSRHTHQTEPLATDDIWDEDENSQPFVYLHQHRSEAMIAKAMGDLPQEQHECLAKVYMEGKSHSEISNELALPLGTVKSRVRLGLKKLQTSFAAH